MKAEVKYCQRDTGEEYEDNSGRDSISSVETVEQNVFGLVTLQRMLFLLTLSIRCLAFH